MPIRENVRANWDTSAEWRKSKLTLSDIRSRTPVWRRYACRKLLRYRGVTLFGLVDS